MSCLLGASVRNAYHTKYRKALSCKVVRKGIFGAGAAFVVFTGVASELFYVSYSKANDGQATYARDTGVRMGNLSSSSHEEGKDSVILRYVPHR